MFYDKMKAKYKKEFNERMHWYELFNTMLGRFEWDGLPDTIPSEQLESILMVNGTVGIGHCKGELYCGAGSYHGDVKGYLPDKYTFAVNGVGEVDGTVGTEIAVGWNNACRTPDWFILQTASILAEIDTSEACNVQYARFVKIPKARDQKEKTAIESAVRAISTGKIDAVISDNIHDARELLADHVNSKDMFLELTDVREIDKLQYLYMYRNEVMTRFYKHCGLNSQFTNKPAQQNNDEIHANDDTAMILFLEEFKYRKRLAEDINRIFNLNTSVRLAEASQDSYDEIILEETGDATEDGEGAESDEEEH